MIKLTNNSLADNLYGLGELMADNLNSVGVSDADVDDGLTTLANKILNVSPSEKVNTVLTLNTPLVVYTDLFTVTGVLKDASDNVISGATIQLIWNDGTEHIATGATNSSGVFSFTSTDPASVSQYSFQLFFAGDSNYNTSNSSVVNVDTAKETSVLVVTSPASGAVVSTDSVTISGTLKDNDGTPLAGKYIRPYINSSYSSVNVIQVGSDGSFSKSISGLSVGRNTVNLKFINETEYTDSTQSLVITRTTFDGLADLELIDGSQILSYADEQQTPGSQYATLETQLMNGDSPATIAGVTVEFWDFTDESAPYFLTSDETDSNGKASFTYPSRGVGDVPIKAVCGSILTTTYTVQDIAFYCSGASVNNSFDIDSGCNCTSNGTYISIGTSTSGEKAVWLPMTIDKNSNWELEFEIGALGTSQHFASQILYPKPNVNTVFYVGFFNTIGSYIGSNGTNWISPQYSRDAQVGDVIKWKYENGTLTLKVNNDTLKSSSYTFSQDFYARFYTNQGRQQHLKNIKFKYL